MTHYRITQPATGVVLGIFKGATEAEALDALATDAGYFNVADMDGVTDNDSDNLQVEPLPDEPVQTSIDQNWNDGTTTVWYDVRGTVYGVVIDGESTCLVDCEGCSIDPWNDHEHIFREIEPLALETLQP